MSLRIAHVPWFGSLAQIASFWNREHIVKGDYLSTTFANDSSGLTWTNMPAALTSLGGTFYPVQRLDLSTFSRVRMFCRYNGAASGAKLALRYLATFSTTEADWLTIGASAVECALGSGGAGNADSGWVDLAAGAKAEVFLIVLGSGGNGAADPTIGTITVEFNNA